MTTLSPEVLASRRASVVEDMKRSVSESYAPVNQLTPWEVVTMGDGSTQIRAQFKHGRSKGWYTLVDLPYMTGSDTSAHNGGENAARIVHAMNTVYPIRPR